VFKTDELPFEVTDSHEVDVHSQEEIEQLIIAMRGKLLNVVGLGEVVCLYLQQEYVLAPFVLIENREGKLRGVPLDRTRSLY